MEGLFPVIVIAVIAYVLWRLLARRGYAQWLKASERIKASLTGR